MAWTTPFTFTANSVPSAEILNAMLVGNMEEQAPAKWQSSQCLVGTAGGFNNVVATKWRRAVRVASIRPGADDGVGSVYQADGPRVSFPNIGGGVFHIFAEARMRSNPVGTSTHVGILVKWTQPSGAAVQSLLYNHLPFTHSGNYVKSTGMRPYQITAQANSTVSFEMIYNVGGDGSTIAHRRLTVIPFPFSQ